MKSSSCLSRVASQACLFWVLTTVVTFSTASVQAQSARVFFRTLGHVGQDESAERKILSALAQRIDFELVDANLPDLLRLVRNAHIPAHLDHKALDDVGIASDTKIRNFQQKSLALRAGLKLVLGDLELAWTIRDGYLLITTPEETESELITRIYDVRNLVEAVLVETADGRTVSYGAPDFDSLIELLTSTTQPDSWEDVGGPGAVEPYYTQRMRTLVVSQTLHVHEQIESLLDKLADFGGRVPLTIRQPSAIRSSRPSVFSAGFSASPRPHAVRASRLRMTGQPR